MISKVIVVFKITAVAIILNTAAGIKNLDPVWLELARSLRLSRWETTYKIRFPGALPYIITGMRLGVGRALLGVVVAELMAANAGLGYLVFFAGQTLNVPTLFVGVAAFALLGILGFELVRRFENYVTPWKKQAQGG
jgi:NitT/TauT family transport system permease protein